MRFVIGMAVIRNDPDTEPELWLRGGGPLGLRCFPRDRGIFPRYDDERPERPLTRTWKATFATRSMPILRKRSSSCTLTISSIISSPRRPWPTTLARTLDAIELLIEMTELADETLDIYFCHWLCRCVQANSFTYFETSLHHLLLRWRLLRVLAGASRFMWSSSSSGARLRTLQSTTLATVSSQRVRLNTYVGTFNTWTSVRNCITKEGMIADIKEDIVTLSTLFSSLTLSLVVMFEHSLDDACASLVLSTCGGLSSE